MKTYFHLDSILVLIIVITYIGSNYLQPLFVVIVGPGLIEYVGRFLGLALFAILSLKRDFLIHFKRYLAYLYLVILVWLLAILYATLYISNQDLGLAMSNLFNILSTCITYIIFSYLCERDEKLSLYIFWALCLFAAINISIGIYGTLTGQNLLGERARDNIAIGVGAFGFDESTGRSGGIRGENYVGLWTSPLLTLLLFEILGRRWLVACFLLSVVASGLATSFSRTTYISSLFIFLIFIIIVLRNKANWHRIVLIFLSLILLIIFVSKALDQQLLFTNEYVYKSGIERLLTDNRTHVWKEWLEVFFQYPFGIGPGQVSNYVQISIQLIPHNSLLSVAVEYGVFGLFLYMVPFIVAYRSSRWLFKCNNYDSLLAMQVASFWGMVVSLIFLSNPFLKIVFLLAGCIEGRKQFFIYRKGITKNLSQYK